jgi:hypothetical protein
MSENRELQRVENPVVVQDTSMFANLLDTNRFKQMYSISKLFAASELVPKQYQGHPANCMVALQMAFRMEVDPMMFMQNTYIVQGRPGIEAKLAIALVNSRGPFTGPIQWKFDGTGKNRACTAYATHKITDEVCEAEVTWAMVEAEGWASKAGSKWKSIPDLMFRYRSAMFLARLYCPEVLLGMHSVDELHDIQPIDVTPKPSLADQVRISSTETEEIDKIAEELSQAQAETTVEPDTDPEPDGRPEPTKEPTPQDRFYNQLGHACDGDEGNMLNLLRSLTGNHGLELCMIQDFEDNSIGILEDKLSDYLSGQEANNA